MNAPVVRVRAHAKINLNLRVLAARPDGYHDLRTVFQAIALHDTLTLASCPGPMVLRSSRDGVPLDSSNLIWRAAELLWQHLGRAGEVHGVTVNLEKRIPMRAGLGGGSSDAAAALLGFARLWQPDVPARELVGLAKRLGADIPFFFTGGAALGLERGDDLYPLADLPPFKVLLVLPGFDVSTADAYRWVDEERERAGRVERRAAGARGTIPGCPWPSPDCDVANDFEAVVGARHPAISEIVGLMHAGEAAASAMTGSGSAVFGLFHDDGRLLAAAEMLTRSGYAIEKTRTLGRDEYQRASEPFAARR